MNAHSPFGGSVASRILHCPASVVYCEKVPATLRKTSGYADRGTALHSVMSQLVERECTLAELPGRTIDGYTITADDVENCLRPVLGYVDPILDARGAEYYLDVRVEFPAIPGTFGTADLIIIDGNSTRIIDFKFGSGVRVFAVRQDGGDEVLNAQLMFYAAAARNTFTSLANCKHFVLTILQPQSAETDAEMVSSVAVTGEELDEFIVAYRSICEQALSPNPRLARGPWCRFCAAKPVCPLHTAPLLDLAQLDELLRLADKEAYVAVLAHILDLADKTKEIVKAAHDQAKQALENGDNVPGYTLSAGRQLRNWRDDKAATVAALQAIGLTRADIVDEEIRSPKQVELRAKARGLKIPTEFIVSSRSGVSLVRAENARAPALGRVELAQSFSEALKAFQEEAINGKENQT
jgi:Protein of unknown function (DUF2800)